eukprot:gene17058-38183_t
MRRGAFLPPPPRRRRAVTAPPPPPPDLHLHEAVRTSPPPRASGGAAAVTAANTSPRRRLRGAGSGDASAPAPAADPFPLVAVPPARADRAADTVLVLIYDNTDLTLLKQARDDGSWKGAALEKELRRGGWRWGIIGTGDQWKGFGTKIRRTIDALGELGTT